MNSPYAKPECLFFDLGGVLFRAHPTLLWERVTRHSPHEADRLASEFFESGLYIPYETGAIDPEDYFVDLKKRFAYTASTSDLMKDWNAFFSPIEENLAFAHSLSQTYRTGIISNTNPTHSQHLEATGKLRELSSLRIYSHEVGFLKPREEIFCEALKRAKLDAPSCLFIDDRQDNVAAAKKLGFHAFTLEPASSLRDLWEAEIIPHFPCLAN